MKLIELTPTEYGEIFNRISMPYGTVDFSLLNAGKVDRVEFLGLQDDKGKIRLGAIFGIEGDKVLCPFSAPFGEISASGTQKIETVAKFIALIMEHCAGRYLRLTFPPDVYGNQTVLKAAAAPMLARYYAFADINYHYDLKNFTEFTSHLDANARNHYNQACRVGFDFECCGLERAYDVIVRNRREKGYPLRMTLGQLIETSKLIAVDSFVMSLDGKDVAAAIVYRLNDRIAQVIYWGHLGEFSRNRPMNLLAYDVFEYYAALNFNIVDIGPSSEQGVADIGLCSFKESLGCQISFKRTFVCDTRRK